MKKYNYIMILLVLIIVLLIGFLGFSMNKKTNIAYVDLNSIYDNFPMKKELEVKLKNVQQARKSILDSLKIQLNALSLSIKSEKDKDAIQKFQIKKQEYLLKEKNFEEDNQSTTQNYSGQIWKQINQYAKDFGKEHDYTVILGADGSGNIMYVDETKNITTEVSKYINERYGGEKK